MSLPVVLLVSQTTQIVGLVVLFVVIYALLYRPVLRLLERQPDGLPGRAPARGGPKDGPGGYGQGSAQTPTPVPEESGVAWYQDRVLLLTVSGVLVADQFTKYLVRVNLDLYESWPREGFVRLTHGINSGTAFGLFPNQTFVLILASLLAIGFLYYFYKTHAFPMKWLRFAIGLQLGGAFGNLVDRVRGGFVVDFIDVGPWPIFNLADSSIVIGIGILVFSTMLTKEKRTKPSPSPAEGSGD